MTVILHMQQASVGLPILTLAISALTAKLGGMPAKGQDIHEMIMEYCRMSAKSMATEIVILHVGVLTFPEPHVVKVDPTTLGN